MKILPLAACLLRLNELGPQNRRAPAPSNMLKAPSHMKDEPK